MEEPEENISAKTLGQIALVQGMVLHLPDRDTIMRFVCRGLELIPGTDRVTYRLIDQATDDDMPPCDPLPLGGFPLKFGGIHYGELQFHITTKHQFEPYIPYLENLSLMLGVIFEERRQRNLNEQHQKDLEDRVAERTRALEKEMGEHQRSRKLLDSIINNTRNVVYVKDLTGRFTLVNDRFCEIFDLTRDRILGRLPEDLFPDHIARQHTDNDRQVLAEKRSITCNEHAVLADGLHEYLSTKFPLLNDDGQVTAVGGVSTDITDLKAVENALRLDEARLEALLTLFQMTDADMNDITDFALQEATKLTKSKIGYLAFTNADESRLTMNAWIPQTLGSNAAGDRRLEFDVAETSLWGEAVRKRRPIVTNDYQNTPRELGKQCPDAQLQLIRHMNVPVFEGDHIVAVAGVGNKDEDYDEADVRQLRLLMQGMWRLIQRMRANEEREELESRLRQAYKMESIGTLAGGIAHDFNNILSAIFGYTELSLSDVAPGTFVHSSLRSIMEAARRARDLVAQILAFSRQGEQESMSVDLLTIAREVGKFIRASLPSSIEIRQSYKGVANVLADPTQMHQVIMNLCTNAGHAMKAKGGLLGIGLETVELDAQFTQKHPDVKPGAYVKLTVSDTGSGIPPELIERIFDPFFTTRERGQGTGMGLSVVHGIVKSHGGTITVYSRLEEGTVFNVFLPAIERRIAAPQGPERALRRGTERILFVDDEETLVNLGITMLGSLGYTVTGISSAADALDKFRSDPHQYDLVITDLTMPRTTGDQLARECLGIRPDIPIILCTGFSAVIDEAGATAMGIRAFINKPLLIRQLSETIRNVLDGHCESN